MMQIVRFEIPGPAVPQGRPRASGRGGIIRLYDPPTSREYKNRVRKVAEQYAPSEPLQGPLHVRIVFYRQFLKSWTKKQRRQAEDGVLLPTTKPDLDNNGKSILDALNGLIWQDDSQIVRLVLDKCYAEEARVTIEVATC